MSKKLKELLETKTNLFLQAKQEINIGGVKSEPLKLIIEEIKHLNIEIDREKHVAYNVTEFLVKRSKTMDKMLMSYDKKFDLPTTRIRVLE